MRPTESQVPEHHWEQVYRTRASDSVSWHRERLDTSLALLEKGGLASGSRVIDVGGGASTLVDDLLNRGVGHVTVLDLSPAALNVARTRLGSRARDVHWISGDVTTVKLEDAGYTAWHDRAVLHFLTDNGLVDSYVKQATRALCLGGIAVIGGFAPDGPARCSGLDVRRRAGHEIASLFGPGFRLLDTRREVHVTPGGSEQAFEYALLERTAGPGLPPAIP